MIDSRNTTLADFLPSCAPFPVRPSFAELMAHMSDCLGLPVDDIERVLAVCDPVSLAIYLAGDHPAAIRLRNVLNLDPEMIDPQGVAEALCAPPGHLCASLFAMLERMSSIRLPPEMVLAARLRHTKRSLLAAWKRALAFAAPAGYLCRDDAYLIGIGEAVFAAMAAQFGKTEFEALTQQEFLQLAPKLIEFWPISEEGLECLSTLLWETEEYIEAHLDDQFSQLSAYGVAP